MALFKKKKEDEDEELDEELPTKRDLDGKLPIKKVRRRNPKKEDKPWGRRERLFLLFTVLLTAGTSAALGLSSFTLRFPRAPHITFSKPSISFIDSETVVLEGGSDSERVARLNGSLSQIFSDLSGGKGLYSMSISDTKTGGIFVAMGDRRFKDTQIKRLLLSTLIFKAGEENKLILNDYYVLRNNDKKTYEEIAIDPSYDVDTLHLLLSETVGSDYVSEQINELGFLQEIITVDETSVSQVGGFIEGLINSTFLSNENSLKVLSTLKNNEDFSNLFGNNERILYSYFNQIENTMSVLFVVQDSHTYITVISGVNSSFSEFKTGFEKTLKLYKK